MEKNNFENKMMGDLQEMLRASNKMFDGAMKDIDTKLKKELGTKGFAKYKAYQNKYLKLHAEGKLKEAAELSKTFLSGK